jgi:uncharacterized protein YeaO (DUF488 family)
MSKLEIKIKRAYAEPAAGDGKRLLIDRLWPRGLSKENAKIDRWFKEVAPSGELRKWYGHEPEKFSEFRHRYRKELTSGKAFSTLLEYLKEEPEVSLLFAAKDPETSNAAVLAEVLHEHLSNRA